MFNARLILVQGNTMKLATGAPNRSAWSYTQNV
jgi:hypothetical protein